MFRIKNDLDYDDFCDLYVLVRRTGRNWYRYLTLTLLGLFALYMLRTLVLSLSFYSLWSFFVIGWFALMIYYVVTAKARYAKGMMRAKEYNTALVADMLFDENGFSQEAYVLHRKCRYSWIKSIAHGYGIYLLKGAADEPVVIPEHCFTEGDPAAFGSFLEQKTGLKIKEIK